MWLNYPNSWTNRARHPGWQTLTKYDNKSNKNNNNSRRVARKTRHMCGASCFLFSCHMQSNNICCTMSSTHTHSRTHWHVARTHIRSVRYTVHNTQWTDWLDMHMNMDMPPVADAHTHTHRHKCFHIDAGWWCCMNTGPGPGPCAVQGAGTLAVDNWIINNV